MLRTDRAGRSLLLGGPRFVSETVGARCDVHPHGPRLAQRCCIAGCLHATNCRLFDGESLDSPLTSGALQMAIAQRRPSRSSSCTPPQQPVCHRHPWKRPIPQKPRKRGICAMVVSDRRAGSDHAAVTWTAARSVASVEKGTIFGARGFRCVQSLFKMSSSTRQRAVGR